jgi:succinate dehydrogenase / fumarate reductase membrane anchor subunit
MVMNFRHPIGRARGLGSAKSGTGHFIAQRVTAVFLVLLLVWFAVAAASLAGADYSTIVAWVSSPIVSVLLISLVGIGCYHLYLGLQVIVEDYVASDLNKLVTLLVLRAVCFLMAVAGIYSVLRISFGGF